MDQSKSSVSFINQARKLAEQDRFEEAFETLNDGYVFASESEINDLDGVQDEIKAARRLRCLGLDAEIRACLGTQPILIEAHRVLEPDQVKELEGRVQAALTRPIDPEKADELLAALAAANQRWPALDELRRLRDSKEDEAEKRRQVKRILDLLNDAEKNTDEALAREAERKAGELARIRPGDLEVVELAEKASKFRARIAETVGAITTSATMGNYKAAIEGLQELVKDPSIKALPFLEWQTETQNGQTTRQLVPVRYTDPTSAIDHLLNLATESDNAKSLQYLDEARARLEHSPEAARTQVEQALEFPFTASTIRDELRGFLENVVGPAIQRRTDLRGTLARIRKLSDRKLAWEEIRKIAGDDPGAGVEEELEKTRKAIRKELSAILLRDLQAAEDRRQVGSTAQALEGANQVLGYTGTDSGLVEVTRKAQELVARCNDDQQLALTIQQTELDIRGKLDQGDFAAARRSLETLENEVKRHAGRQKGQGYNPPPVGEQSSARLHRELAARQGLDEYLSELEIQLRKAQVEADLERLDKECRQPQKEEYRGDPALKAFAERIEPYRRFLRGKAALEALLYDQAARDLNYVVEHAAEADQAIRKESADLLARFHISPENANKVVEALRDAYTNLGKQPPPDLSLGEVPPLPAGKPFTPRYDLALKALQPWRKLHTNYRARVVALIEEIRQEWERVVIEELKQIESGERKPTLLRAENLILEVLEKTLNSPSADEWKMRLLPRIYERMANAALQKKDYESAIAYWKKACEFAEFVQPHQRGLRETEISWTAQRAAEVQLQDGWAEAAREWAGLDARYPNHPEIRYRLANTHYQLVVTARRGTQQQPERELLNDAEEAHLKLAAQLLTDTLAEISIPLPELRTAADPAETRRFEVEQGEREVEEDLRGRYKPRLAALLALVQAELAEQAIKVTIKDGIQPHKSVHEIRDAQRIYEDRLLPAIKERHAGQAEAAQLEVRLQAVQRWHLVLVRAAVADLTKKLDGLTPPANGWNIAWDANVEAAASATQVEADIKLFEERWLLAAKIYALSPTRNWQASPIRQQISEPRNAKSELERQVSNLLKDLIGPLIVERLESGEQQDRNDLSLARQYAHARFLVMRMRVVQAALSQYALANPHTQPEDGDGNRDLGPLLDEVEKRLLVLHGLLRTVTNLRNRLTNLQASAGKEILEKWLPQVRHNLSGLASLDAKDFPARIQNWFQQFYGNDKGGRLDNHWSALDASLSEAYRIDPQDTADYSFYNHRTLAHLRDSIQDARKRHELLAKESALLVGYACYEHFEQAIQSTVEIERNDQEDKFGLRDGLSVPDPLQGEETPNGWPEIVQSLRKKRDQLKVWSDWYEHSQERVDWAEDVQPCIDPYLMTGSFEEANLAIADALDGGFDRDDGMSNEFKAWSLKRTLHYLELPPKQIIQEGPCSQRVRQGIGQIKEEIHDLKEQIKGGEVLIRSPKRVRWLIHKVGTEIAGLLQYVPAEAQFEAQSVLELLVRTETGLEEKTSPAEVKQSLDRCLARARSWLDSFSTLSDLSEEGSGARRRLANTLEDADLMAKALEIRTSKSLLAQSEELVRYEATLRSRRQQIDALLSSRLAFFQKNQIEELRRAFCGMILKGSRDVAPDWPGWKRMLLDLINDWDGWNDFRQQVGLLDGHSNDWTGWSDLLRRMGL